MKYRKHLIFSFILILSSLVTIRIFNIVNTLTRENQKNKITNDLTIKLKECFDLENKNLRRINESLDLIEYCMKEFGID